MLYMDEMENIFMSDQKLRKFLHSLLKHYGYGYLGIKLDRYKIKRVSDFLLDEIILSYNKITITIEPNCVSINGYTSINMESENYTNFLKSYLREIKINQLIKDI